MKYCENCRDIFHENFKKIPNAYKFIQPLLGFQLMILLVVLGCQSFMSYALLQQIGFTSIYIILLHYLFSFLTPCEEMVVDQNGDRTGYRKWNMVAINIGLSWVVTIALWNSHNVPNTLKTLSTLVTICIAFVCVTSHENYTADVLFTGLFVSLIYAVIKTNTFTLRRGTSLT
jgi:hypothetical protein